MDNNLGIYSLILTGPGYALKLGGCTDGLSEAASEKGRAKGKIE